MNKTIDGENSFYEFSFSEFMEIQEIDYSKKNISSYQSQLFGNTSFYGTENFSESMQLLKNGQKENPLEIGDFLKEINFNRESESMILSYEGFSVDVSEYATGNPECMIFLSESESQEKNITINYNCSYNANIEKKTIENYGKMILSIIEIYESQNFNIRLVAIDRTIDSNKKIHNVKITIKDFSESVDRDRISYCLVNPSFLRRNLFKMYEHILDEQYRKDFFDCYGNAMNDLYIENKNDIYIDSPYKNSDKLFFQERIKKYLK